MKASSRVTQQFPAISISHDFNHTISPQFPESWLQRMLEKPLRDLPVAGFFTSSSFLDVLGHLRFDVDDLMLSFFDPIKLELNTKYMHLMLPRTIHLGLL